MSRINTEKEEEEVRELLLEYDGLIPRYTLEGKLLYELECSHKKMYYTLMNLVLKEEIELVDLDDGQYYSLNIL